jgi:uncharacterized protein YlxW (UPF0749 family)
MSLLNNPKKFIEIKKINKVAVILVVLGIGLGLFITAQWRTKTLRVSNAVIPYVALQDTRNKLTENQKNLKKQITDLQNQIKDDQNKLKLQNKSKQKIEEVELYKEKVGLSELKGDGVTIVLDDSKVGMSNSDSITHAADLRDIVNFLWGLGAEAISINNERIVYSTSIDCIVNTVLINSTKTTAPFTISAIGESKRITDELNNENNLKDLHKRIRSDGIIFQVNIQKDITMPVFNGSFPIKFAYIKE